MSDPIDTSAEAVKELMRRIAGSAVAANYPLASTLLALLAERDTWQQMAMDAAHRLMIAETERDAAQTDARVAGDAARYWQEEAKRLTHEVASLRLTLGGRTFDASVPEPIGCPVPGACQTVAEIVRGREAQSAWLRVIQVENTCPPSGKPCDAVRCGCAAEQEMLIKEARDDE